MLLSFQYRRGYWREGRKDPGEFREEEEELTKCEGNSWMLIQDGLYIITGDLTGEGKIHFAADPGLCVHELLPRKLSLLTFLGIMGTQSVLPTHITNFL